MVDVYFAPWSRDIRLPAEFLEAHAARCRLAGVPTTTPPADVPKVEGADRAAERAKADWDEMTAWRLRGLNDGEALLPALKSGLYEYMVLLGGRAGAKSHEVAEALVDLCSRKRKRVVCGREFQQSIRDSSHALLKQKILAHPSIHEWTITDQELRHKNGSLFTFIGMERNPESAKSLEGADIFWGEEAQSFSSKSVEILLPTIREQGSVLIFTANPRYEDDPVPRMALVPAERPEALWYKFTCFEDNPYLFRSRLMSDLRRAFRQSKRFRHVWRGDLDRNSELRIIDYRVGRPPVAHDSAVEFHGIDFGGTDPTAYVRIRFWPPGEKGGRGILYFEREFLAPCKSNRDIVDGVMRACPELATGKWMLKADSADPKAIGELNAAGIPCIGAEKGSGSVLAGLRTLADHDIWIAPECKALIHSAENYRWKTDRAGKPLNVPEHSYSHPWDAARYALEGEDLSGGTGVDYIVLEEL